MTSKTQNAVRSFSRLAVVVLAALGACPALAQSSGTLEITLGQTIQRTWDDVDEAGYRYGPKQDFNTESGETHVWLPYGSKGVYYETAGLNMTVPGPDGTGVPLAVTRDGNTSGRLVYKLRFNKPIGAFRLYVGWSEWGVGGNTVGGVEYSVDGRTWKTIRELNEAGIVEPLVDDSKSKVTGLHARELYIRCYSRDKNNPDKDFGPGRWMKLRMAGDPAWGDRVETFFKCQIQLWVTASDGKPSTPAEEDPATSTPATVAPAIPPGDGPREDGSPWGIASGAEWSGDYPRFNPMLSEAGVRWLRYFPEWQTIQPRQGQWNWENADRLVADAGANHIQVAGVFLYFARWASADGGTRRCPVKDMQYWRDYVGGVVTRYQKHIKYWEVWNEFNGSFAEDGTPEIYADMVREAYVVAKRVDPDVAIGISCANFDVGWLDAVIKAGAADHFDYVCVHPYENMGAVMQGGESSFLSMAGSLRRMLAANKQRTDLPLWITEIGYQAPIQPDPAGDARQSDALVKAYVLSIVQGFERVFWFEARGPAYGSGTDHGIIRKDWSKRPAYDALQTMSRLLGQTPRYLGWLKLDTDGYGFVFRAGDESVLVAWSPPDASNRVKFSAPVRVTDLAGTTTALEAGAELALTSTPLFITDLPSAEVELARGQAKKPFPWGSDFGEAKEVSCRLGAVNDEKGVKQTKLETTAVVNGLTESWRRTDFSTGGEGHYVYFRVDPTFASFGTRWLGITVVARRLSADKQAGMKLCYESLSGYKQASGWWTIPEETADDKWHEHTWQVSDANFVGGWGWNFRIDAISSPNELIVKEVRVTKLPKAKQ